MNGFVFTVTNTVKADAYFSIKDVAPFRKFHHDQSLNGFGIGLYLSKVLCSKIGYSLDISLANGLFEAKVEPLIF
jgi:hypothetical protein